jgi:hypothetical protein
MNAILFSANPNMVNMDDAIRHLANHDELYWEVGFLVGGKTAQEFSYPILGFIHISGSQVEYRAFIRDILPFSSEHYENRNLAERVKPDPWRREWEENRNGVRSYPWKTVLVMTRIEPFSHDTYAFQKIDGTRIQGPPRSYIRVIPPEGVLPGPKHTPQGVLSEKPDSVCSPMQRRPKLAEHNLEEFVVQQLEAIEPGLRLVKRQLSTPAGRLDLLCKDTAGNFVVVELKRDQGTDQAVGQILRYMGWVRTEYRTDKVRGIIVVAKRGRALSFAMRAAPNVEVKEFRLSII